MPSNEDMCADTATPKLSFILGLHKCATNSLVAMINSHPAAWIMCETDFRDPIAGRWGRRLLDEYPALNHYFAADVDDPVQPFQAAGAWAATKIPGLQVYGNKSVSDHLGYSRDYGAEEVVYAVRHICEWVAKDSVEKIYGHSSNIVPTAVFATRHFLESFLLPSVTHVCFEDFYQANAKVVARVFGSLNLPVADRQRQWWKHTAVFPKGDPRKVQSWWTGHLSSCIEPTKSDTNFRISTHPFWHDLLAIYQPYYDAARAGRRIESNKVRRDMERLRRLVSEHSVALDEAYEFHQSGSFHVEMKKARQRRSLKTRLRGAIDRFKTS